MKTRIILTTLLALAVFGGLFGYKFMGIRKSAAAMAGMKPPAVTVATATAVERKWINTLSAIGAVESFQGVKLRSEIEGRIVRIAFESGAYVKAGEVLVELDADTEIAQEKSLEAAAKLAAAALQRVRELRTTNANTPADLDTAEANHAQALAAIEGIKATRAKKRIVAPFTGRLGIRQINIGQFLNKGDAIVTLEAMDPAYVDFALPQQDLPSLKPGLGVRVSIDALPDRVFEGKIEAVDPRVTETTRNARVRAVVPNPDEALRPGFFARVIVVLPGETTVLELPGTAVVYSPYGNSVYVVVEKPAADGTKQLVAEQRFVQTGGSRGDLVSISKGLKAGEQVVIAGQMKLRNGSAVTINNHLSPVSSPDPKPNQS
jgi:membrane fusion protein (multidrug efflux system)